MSELICYITLFILRGRKFLTVSRLLMTLPVIIRLKVYKLFNINLEKAKGDK